jgi:hypothetical protein
MNRLREKAALPLGRSSAPRGWAGLLARGLPYSLRLPIRQVPGSGATPTYLQPGTWNLHFGQWRIADFNAAYSCGAATAWSRTISGTETSPFSLFPLTAAQPRPTSRDSVYLSQPRPGVKKIKALPGSEWGTGCCCFYPGHVGMAGGVSGHVEPCAWDHDPRRGRAWPEPVEACAELSRSGLALPNQASDPEKGAASSAPTI